VLELVDLQVFDRGKLLLGNKVTIHIHQDVFNHDNAELYLLPYLISSVQQVIVLTVGDSLEYWLKQLYCCVLHSVVE
jgi:hypothetical protein